MNEQKKIFTIKNMTEKVGIQCIGINLFVSEKGGPLLNIKFFGFLGFFGLRSTPSTLANCSTGLVLIIRRV